MKHHLSLGASEPLASGEDKTQAALPLSLHLIESVAQSGEVRLVGCEGRPVLCLQSFGDDTIGSFAVCTQMNGNPTALVVLGHVPISSIALALADERSLSQAAKPLVLKCGRSQLQLHPDGRVRITGDDIIVESNGRMGLRGAVVDLN
jgi:hypothetical protein